MGLGLFLEPGGLPRRLGAGGAGSGSGAGVGAGAGAVAPTSSVGGAAVLPRARPTNPSAVEVYAEADAGASQVDDVALVVRQLEAEVPQGDGASQVDHVVLVGVGFHDVPRALLADDLGDDVVAQRAHCVRGVGQAAAAEIQLVVGVHLHEGEDLAAALQEAGAQQVVDALGPAGGGARRIGAAAGELGAQLLVVQDEAVAVVRHGDLVSGLHIRRAREVAADPPVGSCAQFRVPRAVSFQ